MWSKESHTVRRRSKELKWLRGNISRISSYSYDGMSVDTSDIDNPRPTFVEEMLEKYPRLKLYYYPPDKNNKKGHYSLYVHDRLNYTIYTDKAFTGPVPKKPVQKKKTKAQKLDELDAEYGRESRTGMAKYQDNYWSINKMSQGRLSVIERDAFGLHERGHGVFFVGTPEEAERKIREKMGLTDEGAILYRLEE